MLDCTAVFYMGRKIHPTLKINIADSTWIYKGDTEILQDCHIFQYSGEKSHPAAPVERAGKEYGKRKISCRYHIVTKLCPKKGKIRVAFRRNARYNRNAKRRTPAPWMKNGGIPPSRPVWAVDGNLETEQYNRGIPKGKETGMRWQNVERYWH